MRAAALVLLAAFAAPRSVAAATEPAPAAVEVEVREESGGVWNVTYLFPRAVDGIEFTGSHNTFRDGRWTSNVPRGSSTWQVAGGRDRLCFSKPSRSVSVAFRTWTDALQGEPALNAAESDGSRLLHTSHLLVRPLSDCAAEAPADGAAPAHAFRFTAAADRAIRVGDLAAVGSLAWSPAVDAMATWATFGGAAPLTAPVAAPVAASVPAPVEAPVAAAPPPTATTAAAPPVDHAPAATAAVAPAVAPSPTPAPSPAVSPTPAAPTVVTSPVAPAAVMAPAAVEVDVREEPSGVWNVTYLFPRPVYGIEFTGSHNTFRDGRWTSNVPRGSGTWQIAGGRDRLCFSRSSRSVSVAFRTWTDALQGDSALNATASDGSRQLHTSHLLVRPLADCTAEAPANVAPESHRFSFAAPDRAIRVADLAALGSLVWSPPADAMATWVTFGGPAPPPPAPETAAIAPGEPAPEPTAATAAVSPAPPVRPPPTPSGPPVSVTVREDPAADLWNVTYVLSRPAAGVEFTTGRNAFRGEHWTSSVFGGSGSWQIVAGHERLCFSQPSHSFSVAFRSATQPLEGEPALNATLSDGSRLLHTGHLVVEPLSDCTAVVPPSDTPSDVVPPVHRFDLGTAADRDVRVLDRTAPGSLSWAQPAGDAGTYVVFGDVAPAESSVATVIVDPGLPAWLRGRIDGALPRTLERAASMNGSSLVPLRPLVVVAWGGDAGLGRTFNGAALPGLVLASFAGPGWKAESPDAHREAVHGLAREIFRLWGEIAFEADADAAWIPAAGAERFAVEATLALGVATATDVQRRLVAQANDCVVRLEGRTMVAAGAGDEVAWTACGAVALAATDGALRRAQPPSDLAQLFRRLFEHASVTGSYNTAAFFGALRELRADGTAASELWRLIWTGGALDGDALLKSLVARAGVETRSVAPLKAEVAPSTLREAAARAIGRCWCGSEAGKTCQPAAIGRTVTTVGGQPLAQSPLAAWERLDGAIRRSTALTVVVDGLSTDLFCSSTSFDPTWDALLVLPESAAGR